MIFHHDILNIALGVAVAVGALGGLWAIYSVHQKLNRIMVEVTKKRTLSTIVFLLSFASNIDAAQVRLIWTPQSSNETGFGVERKTKDLVEWQLLKTVPKASRSAIDETVNPGIEYCYQVYAYNEHGQSARTNVACITVPTIGLPPDGIINLKLDWKVN